MPPAKEIFPLSIGSAALVSIVHNVLYVSAFPQSHHQAQA